MSPIETEEDRIIAEIRKLAGELGVLLDSKTGMHDADEYEHQVHIGLARVATEILGNDPRTLLYWLGLCFIELGLRGEDDDPWLQETIDELQEKVEKRDDEIEDEE